MADIVDTAVSAGSFNTLVAAVKAANLVDTLKGAGPFTVFAPTDEAFAKLPEGTVDGLLQDIPKLTKILTYHVVPGKVTAADVVNLTSVHFEPLTLLSALSVVTERIGLAATASTTYNEPFHLAARKCLPKLTHK